MKHSVYGATPITAADKAMPQMPMDLPACFVTPIANKIDLYLTSEIGEAADYVDWFNALKSATEKDVVNVYINSPGGYLDTALQIYHALQACPAQITIHIEGGCCSGASMIAMAADCVCTAPGAYVMIHSWTGGAFGKFGNVIENTEFQKDWFSKVVKGVYEDFLTEQEIESVLIGKDLWYGNEKLAEKLDYMFANKQKKLDEESKHARDFEKAVNKFVQGYVDADEKKSTKKTPAKKTAPKKAKTEPKKKPAKAAE